MNLVKANLILGGVAVALLVPTLMTLASERELYKDIAGVPLMFDGYSTDNVAALVLATPKEEQPEQPAAQQGQEQQQPQVSYDELVFQRSDKGWVLGQNAQRGQAELAGAKVNEALLQQNVFEHLAAVPRDPETLVYAAATDEQLAEVGLDLEHAYRIRAVNAQQQTVAEVLVGPLQKARGKDSAAGVYVREAGSNEVVFYEGAGRMPFAMRQPDPAVWLDRVVAQAPPDGIRRMAIRNERMGTEPVVFTRAEGSGVWQCENPPAGKGALRQAEVARLAQTFCNLYAQQVVGRLQGKNLAGLGLYPGTAELALTWVLDDDQKTEKAVRLWSGSAVDDKKEHYLRVEGNDFLLTWGEHYATRLQDPGELFDPAAPAGGSGNGEGKAEAPVAPAKEAAEGEKQEAGGKQAPPSGSGGEAGKSGGV